MIWEQEKAVKWHPDGERWYQSLTRHRWRRYLDLFEGGGIVLGCGCATGELSRKVAQKVGARCLIGIDLNQAALVASVGTPLLPLQADLNEPFPLVDESVDVVSSDQVIEHLPIPDHFVTEIYRVLKPGGYAVICTENLSAIQNLLALMLGQQAFSQHVSRQWALGNVFSPHYRQNLSKAGPLHIHIFTPRGLRDIFEAYGFHVESFRGIGYFPLPMAIGQLLAWIDPIHAYFIAVKVRKPASGRSN